MRGYDIIWELKIRHGYYANGINPGFEVRPTRATELLMMRRGAIFKKRDAAQWILIGPADTTFTEADALEMNVYAKDPSFPYVTEYPKVRPGRCPQLKLNGMEQSLSVVFDPECPEVMADPGVMLKIFFLLVSKPETQKSPFYANEIFFRSPERYLEYIFLFRNTQSDKVFKLEDLLKKVEFLPIGNVVLNGVPGIGFLSARKISISQNMGIQLRLVEVLGTCERVVVRDLSFPTPGVFHDTSPDRLRHIMYI